EVFLENQFEFQFVFVPMLPRYLVDPGVTRFKVERKTEIVLIRRKDSVLELGLSATPGEGRILVFEFGRAGRIIRRRIVDVVVLEIDVTGYLEAVRDPVFEFRL